MQATICSNCGLQNTEGRKTCKKCQAPLDPTQQVVTLSQTPNSPVGVYTSPTASLLHAPALPVSASGYEYFAVPFVGNLRSGVFSLENAGVVTAQLQGVINQYVAQGWDYYSMEKVNIQITPGCLASLLGQREAVITFDQLIFRRQRP